MTSMFTFLCTLPSLHNGDISITAYRQRLSVMRYYARDEASIKWRVTIIKQPTIIKRDKDVKWLFWRKLTQMLHRSQPCSKPTNNHGDQDKNNRLIKT